MKKIILIMAMTISIFSSSFAQFVQSNLTGWPLTSGYVSSATKIVADATYYYAITDNEGIYRIPKTNIAPGSGGSWSAFNTGLPAAGLSGGFPYYGLADMDICGTYLYVLCSVSGSTSEAIYRVDLSSSTTFSPVSPSTPLVAGEPYILKAAGSYVFVAQTYSSTSSTLDIRSSANTTTTWSTVTLNPGGTTPYRIYSINALSVSGRYDLHFCASNGLFIKGLATNGAPTGGLGLITSFGECHNIEYIYNSSGVFTWAYVTTMVPTVPGHSEPGAIMRVASGSSTPSPVTMTPASTASIGEITSLATWQGNAHFGLLATGAGVTLSGVLYKGDNTANNFSISNFCGGGAGGGVSSTAGTMCMYADNTAATPRLLAGTLENGIWITSNVSCKTDATTGITELGENSINVYPMPATSELNITYPATIDGQPAISLYDMQGRLQNVVVKYMDAGEAKINVAELGKGIYLLEYNNGSKITKRVVID